LQRPLQNVRRYAYFMLMAANNSRDFQEYLVNGIIGFSQRALQKG
jgi:hypothetical protein